MHQRPSSLLENINAATRTTIFGTPGPFTKEEREYEGTTQEHGDFARAETPSEAMAGTLTGDGETSRPAHARYSFEGGGEGELPLKAGQEIEVLDDRDSA